MQNLAAETEMAERAGFQVLDDVFAYHATRRPDDTAYIFEGQTLSYGALNARANQVANGLMFDSDRQGRVAHLGKNNSRFFELLVGCARSGRVLCPVNWRLSLAEISALLLDFDVQMLFVDAEFAGHIDKLRAEVPTLRRIIMIEGSTHGCDDFDQWRDAQPSTEIATPSLPEDVVFQMHTSGTTGLPKGAMLTNRTIVAQMRRAETGEIGQWSLDDIIMVPLPVFHVGGTCFSLYGTFIGATNYLTREASSGHILAAFRKAPITKAGFVPAVIQMVLNDPAFDAADIETLQMVTFGGAPITLDLLQQAIKMLDCDFVQMFGMTETTSLGTAMLIDRDNLPSADLLKSVGRPYRDFEVRIIDRDGADLPEGQSGEILLRSPCIMKGYYNRPKATAEVIRDGWYHTGDGGYVDADGYLFINDRIKDMVITGGENVYPAEVEQALAVHPAVLESGVIGIPSVKWGEDVLAFVVLRPGEVASEADLITFCRARIAHFKCPKSVEFIDVLPRNASGKVLKRVLRAPYWPDKPAASE